MQKRGMSGISAANVDIVRFSVPVAFYLEDGLMQVCYDRTSHVRDGIYAREWETPLISNFCSISQRHSKLFNKELTNCWIRIFYCCDY